MMTMGMMKLKAEIINVMMEMVVKSRNLFHVQKSISGKNNINEKQEEKNHHSKKRPRIVYLS